MLNLKMKLAINLLTRFFACWLISTLIFSTYLFIQSRLNYEFKFHENWRYERNYTFSDLFMTSSLGFLIICLLYFTCISIFKIKLRSFKSRSIFSAIITILILLSFASLWGNPFRNVNILYSLFIISLMALNGLSIAFTDNIIQKWLEKLNNIN